MKKYYKVTYDNITYFAMKIDGVEILGLTRISLGVAVKAYKEIKGV